MEEQWKKVISGQAADIIDVSDLHADSRALLKPGMRPEAYIRELSAAKKWPDAVRVMARALPPREAVWWVCVCARQVSGVIGEKNELAALEASEKWVFKPTEAHRVAAFKAAQQGTARSLGTLAAMAVAFIGGKLSVAEGQVVDVDPAAFSQLVDAAIMASATEKQGSEMMAQFEQALRRGEDIARGGNGKLEPKEG